jgi:hypothetical protein
MKVAAREDAYVVTMGFDRIVSPILGASETPPRLIAMPWLDHRARDRGKLARLREEVSDEVVARSLLVTDNLEADADVAAVAQRVARWPAGDDAGGAFPGVYHPFRYADEVKKAPSRFHTPRQLLLLVLPILFISTYGVGSYFPEIAPLLLAISMSFFCVYEIGYVENDVLATKIEENPSIPVGCMRWGIDEIASTAWTFAALLLIGGVGYALLILNETLTGALGLAARWIAYLVALRLVFAGFNRQRPAARVPWFVGLHVFKLVGPIAVMLEPASPVGWALILAHLVATTAPYALYRWTAVKYRYSYTEARRLALYCIALVLLGATAGLSAVTTPAAAMGLAWCAYVARRDLGRLALLLRGGGGASDAGPA